MSAYIYSLASANPTHKIDQLKAAQFLTRYLKMEPQESRKLLALSRMSGIEHRYSCLPDFNDQPATARLYDPALAMPSLSKRMECYAEEALPLSLKAASQSLKESGFEAKELTHLITISCTGMYAPGLDIQLVEKMGLKGSVARYAINFMGCYAAMVGLRMAKDICEADAQAVVMVVSTELCTLHVHPNNSDDNLLSHTLFGDGSSAVVISNAPGRKKPCFAINDSFSELIPEGKNDMAWKIGDLSFEMRLSQYIPDLLEKALPDFFAKLIKRLPRPDLFALHPGGKRILDKLEDVLEIPRKANSWSHQVLKDFGNMSSPTILYVLEKLYKDFENDRQPRSVLSLAFGPGLTMEGAHLTLNPLD